MSNLVFRPVALGDCQTTLNQPIYNANMPNHPLKIALLQCNSQPCSPAPDTAAFPNLSCINFKSDEDFRTSFCNDDFDAVLCLCQHSAQPETLAIVEWIRCIQCSRVPVVVLADNDDESAVAETLYAGADDVQTLPVIPNVLSARIVSMCSRVKPHSN